MSTISVIIPTYNRAHLIGETLHSLMAQTRRPDQVLVIDDGSTDDTPDVLARFDGLTVVRTENSGKARALNRALGLVTGDLVWILDDDDIVLPEACARLSAPLDADGGLDFCAGRHLDFVVDPVSGGRQTREPGYMRDSAPDQIFPDLLEGCHIFQPGLMVRRRVYDAVGPFDVSLVRSQDYDMLLRIARRHRGLQLDEVVFLHREHDGVRGSAADSFAASRNADKWAEYNRIIFTRLLADASDDEILAASDLVALPDRVRVRAAMIKRGCVMARQRMWPEAFAVWQAAASLCPENLSGLEREMLGRSPNAPIGAPELFLRENRAALAALAKGPYPGPEMARIVRRAARWRVRAAMESKDWRQALAGVRLMLQR